MGGRDAALKSGLRDAFTSAGFAALDAAGNPDLDGDDPGNIVNRNLSGAGVQLELTTPLRGSMFGTNTGSQRKHTTTEVFWRFVGVARAGLAG